MSHFQPKNILVAYDLSDVSRTAWKHAAAMAAHSGASLTAVYVEPWQVGVDLMPPPTLTPGRVRLLRKAIARVVGDKTTVVILQGNAAERILSYARRHRNDLIVVGTNGRTGLKRVLLGSVAEDIIRGAPVPVLAARGVVRPIRSILAPVNFTTYAEHGLAYAVEVAIAHNATLVAHHVTDDPVWGGNIRFRLNRLFNRLSPALRNNCRIKVSSSIDEIAAGIVKARRGHDLLVMVAHEKSMLEEVFFGTTLERVLRRSSVPVLSVPFPSRNVGPRSRGLAVSSRS